MDLQLSGRTALVTGASRGIGLAVVRTLTAEGMRVVAGSRTTSPELAATGAVPVLADLTTPEGAQRQVDEALAALGGLDVLVSNVGRGESFATGGFLSADHARSIAGTDHLIDGGAVETA